MLAIFREKPVVEPVVVINDETMEKVREITRRLEEVKRDMSKNTMLLQYLAKGLQHGR